MGRDADLKAIGASPLRRDFGAAHGFRSRGSRRKRPTPHPRGGEISLRTRMAGFRRRHALRPSRHRDETVARRLFPLTLAQRRIELPRLVEGPHWLSDRRCGNAATLAHGLYAQSGANDRRLFSGQASADRLAARRGMVLGHALRRRPGRRTRSTGSGSRVAAPTRRPISAFSTRCCRRRNSTPMALTPAAGFPSWRSLAPPHLHAPWTATNEALRQAGIVLGKTYPKPIVDHAAARARALAAFAQMRG